MKYKLFTNFSTLSTKKFFFVQKPLCIYSPYIYGVFSSFPHCPQPVDKNIHSPFSPQAAEACSHKQKRRFARLLQATALSSPLYFPSYTKQAASPDWR